MADRKDELKKETEGTPPRATGRRVPSGTKAKKKPEDKQKRMPENKGAQG